MSLESCLLSCNWEEGLTACTDACYIAANWSFDEGGGSSTPLYISIIFATFLIMLSGLFSGLTLGLMSLDTIGLQILEEGGEGKEPEYAKAILPVRRRGNLLLCTLLLGNTLVNALIAILLAGLTSGVLGGILSTFVIVIFGEIIPQAACSRNGLYIGANSLWLVKIFIVVCFPVAWPISLILDKVLGREMGNMYNIDELKKLINIHVENPDAAEESGLTKQDQMLLCGALEYKDKSVQDVMTTLDKVFMLEISARLNFQLMFSIYKSGFTRVPVYETHRQNVVGILFVKDLILVDPDDEVEVRAILAFHGDRSAGYVKRLSEKTTLDKVFKYFKSSYIHLLFAFKEDEEEDGDMIMAGVKQDGKNKEITGIISLEDVLEEVIKEEIVDEMDNFVDVNAGTAVMGRRGHRRDLGQFMALFEHKLRKQDRLSTQEINAIAAYLTTNVKVFSPWKDSIEILKGLIKMSELFEYPEEDSAIEDHDPQSQDWQNALTLKSSVANPSHSPPRQSSSNVYIGPQGNSSAYPSGAMSMSHSRSGLMTSVEPALNPSRWLYKRQKPADFMVLVLQGKVQILAGVEEFVSELGPWTAMGFSALSQDHYVPDFDATVLGCARLLVIRASAYHAALRTKKTNHSLHPEGVRHSISLIDHEDKQSSGIATPEVLRNQAGRDGHSPKYLTGGGDFHARRNSETNSQMSLKAGGGYRNPDNSVYPPNPQMEEASLGDSKSRRANKSELKIYPTMDSGMMNGSMVGDHNAEDLIMNSSGSSQYSEEIGESEVEVEIQIGGWYQNSQFGTPL